MLACYPGNGARFKRHVDNDVDSPDTRAVTAVLYLNSQFFATRPPDFAICQNMHIIRHNMV